MRSSALLLFVALAGCASGSGSGSPSRPETMRISDGSGSSVGQFNIVASNGTSVKRVAYPLDKVWRALPGVYDSLKVPLTTVDPSRHFIGNEGMKIRQKLGSVALSQYLDCGQAQIGPSADTYDVFLSVVTTLRATSPTETEMSTTVESAAKPPAFGQEYSRCTSRGAIENNLLSILNARLAK